jgi:hypothetical protein
LRRGEGSALVLMMTGPGLALFYSGLVRRKNVLGTMMQSFNLTAWTSPSMAKADTTSRNPSPPPSKTAGEDSSAIRKARW